MGERRYAILISSSEYEDQTLQDLRCAERDVEGLNEILASEKHGRFSEPLILKNRPSYDILNNINRILKKASKDDLVLIYFSGHGKLNRAGKLHLATIDTEIGILESTSVTMDAIKSYIDVSASNKVIIILDSCFSGSAGKSFTKGNVDDQLQLVSEGRGTYLMTGATGVQTALEKEGDHYSVFTKHIIEGIKSGEADLNGDTLITMDELYSYVHDRVLEESHQEPTKYNLNVRGDLIIANSGKMRRDERARVIREILQGQYDNGNLPKDILSRSLEIVDAKSDQLSEADLKYEDLLDQLHLKSITLGEFIENWYKIKLDQLIPREIWDKDDENIISFIDKTLVIGIGINKPTYVQFIGSLIISLRMYMHYYYNNYYSDYGLFSLLGISGFFILIFLFINAFILGWISYRKNILPGILNGWLIPLIVILFTSIPFSMYDLVMLSLVITSFTAILGCFTYIRVKHLAMDTIR